VSRVADPILNRVRRVDIVEDIASDVFEAERRRVSKLLLKAVRSLSRREQDTVLSFLVGRALVSESAPARPGSWQLTSSSLAPTAPFAGVGIPPWPGSRWEGWGGSVILRRLAEGASVVGVAGECGVEPDVLRAALRDVVKRPKTGERSRQIIERLAEGRPISEAAAEVGIKEERVAAELVASETLAGALGAALSMRAALPLPPSESLATSTHGPLRTMPVRFPEPQYERLKQWCEQHGFPMAVVVRGLVERFLDEQQRRAA